MLFPSKFLHRPTLAFGLIAWAAMGLFATYLWMSAEFSRAERHFVEETEIIASEIRHKLDTNEAVLSGFAAFLQSVDQGDQGSAARYAAATIASYPHIYMLEVARKVARSEQHRFAASMRKGWRKDFTVRDFSNLTKRSAQGQAQGEYVWPILFMYPPLPDADAIYGVQLETVGYLSEILSNSSAKSAPVASPMFELFEGGAAYIVLKQVNRQASPGSQNDLNFFGNSMVALIVVKAQALIPAQTSKFIQFSAHLAAVGTSVASPLFEKPASPAGLLDRFLLPRFKRSLDIGNRSQAVSMSFEQEMRWSELLKPEFMMGLALIGITSCLCLFGLLRYNRQTELTALAHERASYLATHDALTDLPNRYLLTDRFEQARQRWRRNGNKFAIMLIDLDYFKEVNDAFGHEVGDQVLATMANRLRQGLRASDTVARYGGDEFVVLLTDILDAEGARLTADKLLTAVSAPLSSSAGLLSITGSLGIAICPQHGETFDALYKAADQAMYRAKAAGRNASDFLIHPDLTTT